MKRYIITKQFRDPSGLRLPGETIELTPSRAAALRSGGLIGEEYRQEQKKEEPEQKEMPEQKTESKDEAKKDKAKKNEAKRKAGK